MPREVPICLVQIPLGKSYSSITDCVVCAERAEKAKEVGAARGKELPGNHGHTTSVPPGASAVRLMHLRCFSGASGHQGRAAIRGFGNFVLLKTTRWWIMPVNSFKTFHAKQMFFKLILCPQLFVLKMMSLRWGAGFVLHLCSLFL